MKQAVMTSPGHIEFHEVPVPVPAKGEVLLRIKRIGVCGSDIHVWHGKHSLTPYPVVQGHEVSGVIEKIGEGIQGLVQGDAVTFQPQVTCGRCYPCMHGSYHICDNLKVMGFQTTGAGSEFFAVKASKLLKLPPGMRLDYGAMLEPTAVAVHAIGRYGDVLGKQVLVLGAGPIGNLVAQTARALGAARVLITDVSDFRLGKAKECGVPLIVNTARTDIATVIYEMLGENKADVIFECVGISQTISQAVGVARKGTDIIVVGVFGSPPSIDLGTVQDRELRLIGTLMYREPDWKTAMELIQAGKIDLSPLITDRFVFEDYVKAYEYIDGNPERTMKVLIELGD